MPPFMRKKAVTIIRHTSDITMVLFLLFKHGTLKKETSIENMHPGNNKEINEQHT